MCGKDLKRLGRDRARDIGEVFLGYNRLTNATAVQNMELSMRISRVRAKKMRQAAYGFLEQVGIDRKTADRKVLKLSGGEPQRMGIARAHNPNLMIVDEPIGNLDGAAEETIPRIFRGIAHEQGKCVIIVTHSNSIARGCDMVHHLEKGKLTTSG